MRNNKILLIAMGVSMTDIRTAMALQKLDEDDFIVINNEEDSKTVLEGKTDDTPFKAQDHVLPSLSFELRNIRIEDVTPMVLSHSQRNMGRTRYQPRINQSQHKPNRSRHPQMVRRG